jgi:PadR family transcriptional regulator AphA
MQDTRLSPTSYIVLGFVSLAGHATPYELKRMVAQSVGYFWSFPHSQLYAEPERLAAAGYLNEEREESGRRRKRYAITERGRRALEDWVSSPTEDLAELRDPATLQLFFGADPQQLADVQLPRYREVLAELEALRGPAGAVGPPGPALALEYGIAVMRTAVRFWSALAAGEPPGEAPQRTDGTSSRTATRVSSAPPPS